MLPLSFAWAVKFSRLYHAPQIEAVRATLHDRLVFSSTLNRPGLAAGVIGIALGAWVGHLLRVPRPTVEK